MNLYQIFLLELDYSIPLVGNREFPYATFRATTIDFYNSFEFGSIAWECRHQASYNINADSLIVEVIREGREVLPGEGMEIVITTSKIADRLKRP